MVCVKHKAVALVIASIVSVPLSAQAQATGDRTMEEIVVSASGIRHSPVTPLTAGTSDTASLLRNIPGVDLRSAGGVSSIPGIRGLSGDRVRTKLDGMDLISSCANHMNPPLSYIDPSNVDTVDVVAGITPVSVGGDSIGGTIIVNSAAPEFASSDEANLIRGEGETFYRSNGDGYGGNVSATLASKLLSLNYDGATAQADNYKAGNDFKPAGPAAKDRGFLPGDEVGSTYYDSTNQFMSVGLQHENHLADVKVRYQHISEQGFPNQRMDMTDNKSHSINLGDKATFDWGVLESRVYYEKTRHSMNFGQDKQFMYGDVPGMPMETEGKNIGATIKAGTLLSSRDILRTGLEYQAYRLDDWWPPSGTGMMMSPNTFENINDGTRDRYAIFGEWESRWSGQWTTVLGARAELVRMNTGDVQGYSNTNGMGMGMGMVHNYLAESTAFNERNRRRTDENVDVTALARYTPDANQTYEAGVARKTRSPNLYERYSWSTSGMSMLMVNLAGDGNGYVGNLDLEPEVANTISATANWHDARRASWEVEITPYLTYVDDFIDAKRCVSNTPACGPANQSATDAFVYLQFVNQNARLHGVDVSGSYLALQHVDFGRFTVSGVVGYTSGENRKTNDNLYNIMPLNAKLSLEQRVGNWTNVVEAQFVADKDNVSAVRNEIQTGSYNVYSLRSSYEWKQFRVDVGVENLTDEFYDLPLGGAYVGQGMTMSGTGVPWGIAVPGMGRSIYTGLSMRF
ncbi:MAG: TonB-dependent receptor plug domain-containing protein [Haliea sp.]|nr:TonB-dependent receptor plug domain-containing protein [Haliea sp.]